MPRKTGFRMMRKPSEPKRKTYWESWSLDDGSSPQEAIDAVLARNGDPDQARFSHDRSYHDDSCYGLEVHFPVPEDEEVFEVRKAQYREKLARYREWEKAHPKEISEYKRKKQEKEEARRAREREQKRKSLEKQKKSIERDLSRLT